MKNGLLITLFLLSTWTSAQVPHPSHRLAQWGIPPANYSGITSLGDGRYAVVSDKESHEGFYLWTVEQDSTSGDITYVQSQGFVCHLPDTASAQAISARDAEDVVYVPRRNTVFISGEGDQEIAEYTLAGEPTGIQLEVPEQLKHIHNNYGFEALAYDTLRHRYYTCTENCLPSDGKVSREGSDSTTLLRIQAFDDSLRASLQWAYLLDMPQCGTKGRSYAHGVTALTALRDGSIAVLEREVHITQDYNKSRVWNRLYLIRPTAENAILPNSNTISARQQALGKELLAEWNTRFTLFGDTWANYEGMCLGKPTTDGRETLLMVSDSQGGLGVGPFRLKDWIRVFVLPTLRETTNETKAP